MPKVSHPPGPVGSTQGYQKTWPQRERGRELTPDTYLLGLNQGLYLRLVLIPGGTFESSRGIYKNGICYSGLGPRKQGDT